MSSIINKLHKKYAALNKALGARPGSPVWKWQQRRAKIKETKEKATIIPTPLPYEAEKLLERYGRKRLITNKLIEKIRQQGEPAVDENLRFVNIIFGAFLIGSIIFGGLAIIGIISFLFSSPLIYRPLSYWLGFGFVGFIAVICLGSTLVIYAHRKRMYQLVAAFERAEITLKSR